MLVIHPKDKTTAMLSALSDQFARADGLYGLFTEMIDSEESDALLYRVETSQEERDCENVKLAMGLSAMNSGQMC